MIKKYLKKYLEYANTNESFAVLFAKKHLYQTHQTNKYWIDIIDYDRDTKSSDILNFRFVVGGLYKREIKIKYPPKDQSNEKDFMMLVRAITWEAAHKDIEHQKLKKIVPSMFKITRVERKNVNYFIDTAPPEIKALAKNLNDRTNPLWDRAEKYVNRSFYYKIKFF